MQPFTLPPNSRSMEGFVEFQVSEFSYDYRMDKIHIPFVGTDAEQPCNLDLLSIVEENFNKYDIP